VYIDANARFLKMLIHKCYINKQNLCNQVSLIAINCIGEPSRRDPGVRSAGPSKPNPFDDLSFDMNFDPATADKIRKVAQAKKMSADREDFVQAKQLKLIEDHLKAVGMKLAKLESAKVEAVNEEDYDRAKTIKAEIEHIRSDIDRNLNNIPIYKESIGGGSRGGNYPPGPGPVPARRSLSASAVSGFS
jgi:centrosomal protein CEP104